MTIAIEFKQSKNEKTEAGKEQKRKDRDQRWASDVLKRVSSLKQQDSSEKKIYQREPEGLDQIRSE